MLNPTVGSKNMKPIVKGQTGDAHVRTILKSNFDDNIVPKYDGKCKPKIVMSNQKPNFKPITKNNVTGQRDRNKNALRKLRMTYTGLCNNHKIDPKTKFHIALLQTGNFYGVLGDLIHQDLEFANLIQNQADNSEDLDLKFELQLKAAKIRQPIEDRLMKLMEMRYAVVKSETELNLISEILQKWKKIDEVEHQKKQEEVQKIETTPET